MQITANKSAAVKRVMTVVLVVQSVIGFSMGVYETTCGAYFYERFGGSVNPSTAILLATALLAVRQGLITLLEMPSGALADTIGRVQVVVISWIARTAFFISLAAMWFCSNITLAVICGVVASIFWAICYTCFNGAFSAWCVDYLHENAPEYPYSMLASRSHNYFVTAAAVGTPIGIIFYLSGLPSLIYAVVGLSCFLCMGYCLMQMKETVLVQFVERSQVTSTTIFRNVRGKLWQSCTACWERPMLFWIVLTFGSFMFLLNIVEFLWPIFLKTTTGASKWSVEWIGLAMGCNIACVISSRLFVWISKRFNEVGNPVQRLTLFSWVFAGSSIVSALMVIWHGYATAYGVNSFSLLVITVLSVLIAYGFMGGCFETLINHYIGKSNEQDRATIISSGSFIRGLLFVFLAVPSAGSSASNSPIYWAIPAGILLVSSSVSLVMLKKVRKEEPIAAGTAL